MKKFTLSFIIAAVACVTAHASVTILATQVTEQDMYKFAMPVGETYQNILNQMQYNSKVVSIEQFQPEYLITATDFTKGDLTLGDVATLPSRAKVTGLALTGYNTASTTTELQYVISAWVENTAATALDHLAITDVLSAVVPNDDYKVATEVTSVFDDDAKAGMAAGKSGTIVDLPFDVPFAYTGGNVKLTLLMNNANYLMAYRYFTYNQAETSVASTFRSPVVNFNAANLDQVKLLAPNMFDIAYNSLPAFNIPFYTNDIRVTVADATEMPVITLTDASGNEVAPSEENVFTNLDHNGRYILTVTEPDGTTTAQEITFDTIGNDVDVIITVNTAVNDITASKAVAGTSYYNLQGQPLSEMQQGVNIVVTTYTDGTRLTSKVMR